MVQGNEINVCRVCDVEIVGRAEVEKIVRGRETLFLPRDKMRWNSYTSGHSFIYTSYDGQTGSKGETKNIVCGCNVEKGVSPSLMMIRVEFRDRIIEKFGKVLSAPFLFKLPPAMVAWENSAFVCADTASSDLMLSDDGLQLIDVIADMSRSGVFEGEKPMFLESDVLSGFSYLHLVKPQYRSFVATDLGPECTVVRVLNAVPDDWIDWKEMASLRLDKTEETVELKRVVGAPAVDKVAGLPIDDTQFVVVEPVVPGVAVARNNTCVQLFDPVEDDGERFHNSFRTKVDENRAAVVLGTGQTFLPDGKVSLTGHYVAVTFDPGVMVYTTSRTTVTAPFGSVTVFINGTVDLELRLTDVKYDSVAVQSDMTNVMYRVGAVVDSYAHGTKLAQWYASRFDVLSTEARFYVGRAEMVLLASVDSACKVLTSQAVLEKMMSDGDEAIAVTRYSGQSCASDEVSVNLQGPMIVRNVQFEGDKRMVLNGCLSLSSWSAVGLTGVVRFRFDKILEGDNDFSPLFQYLLCQGYRYDVVTVVDAFSIDRGGPSGSEGEYFDETDTFRVSNTIDVLQSMFLGQEIAPMAYLKLAKHGPTMAFYLGVAPTFRELITCHVSLIDPVALEHTGLGYINGQWQVVDKKLCVYTWADIYELVKVSYVLTQSEDTFGKLLRTSYAVPGEFGLSDFNRIA